MEIKSNFGDVSKGINKATKSTKKLAKETEDVSKATKKSSKGFGMLSKAVKGVGKAFSALGIIAIVTAAFTALKEAMERNQKIMDNVNTIMSTISTTFNQVITVISDVVNWVTESSDRFDGLSNVLGGLITLALTPLQLAFYGVKLGVQQAMLAWEDSFLGGGDEGKIAELRADIVGTQTDIYEVGIAAIDAGKNVASNIGDAISEVGAIYEKAAEGINNISIKGNYEQAKATTAATKAALFAEAEFAKLNAEKLKEAELFRQIRDDETKSFAERIQANKDLKKSLEEQQKLQREQVQIGIRAAALLVEQNGSDENKLALMQAQNAELELEETITGQLSEQKTNQVGLEKELLETQNQLRAEGLAGMERELEELQTSYDAKIEMARKAGVDTTEITKQYEKEQTDIKDAEADKQKALDKAVRDAKVAMAQSGLSLITEIAGEGSKIGQAAALASATISGVEGVQNAFTTAQDSPLTAVMPAYPFIQAGLAGAFSAIQIAKIASGSKAGGGGGGGASAAPATPAPQMMSGAFDISGGVKPEASKAYVVTDEMTNSQNQLSNIRRRATI